MKKTNRIRVLIPTSAPDLDSLFTNKRWADDARAIFHYMYREKRIMEQNREYKGGISRESGWVSVNASELKKGTDRKTGKIVGISISNRYKEIRDVLVRSGCLEVYTKDDGVSPYTPGLYSRLWRPKFKDPKLTGGRKYRQEFITNKATISNMVSFYNRKYKEQRKEFLVQNEWYRENLQWAEKMYLSEAAVKYAETQSPNTAEKLLGSIGAINSKTSRYIARCEFGGRIHSFWGGLDKRLRPFLQIDCEDEELICIDIKSAQPYLLATLFNTVCLVEKLIPEFCPILQKITERQHDPSTKMFLTHCLDGTLYMRLMEVTGMKNYERFKSKLFQHVLYSSASNHHRKPKIKAERLRFREQFKSLYRSPYETITAIKRTQSRTLPFVKQLTSKRGKGKMYASVNMVAQRLEVAIFLNLVTKRLNEAGVITVTIHDAWIMKKKHRAIFDKVLESVCAELSIPIPKRHIEALNGATNSIEPKNSQEK